MEFESFIKELSEKDLKNFNQYKDIRGIQTYRIIFEALRKKNNIVTYSDVNSLVMYDKALKDMLYTYLGTLEDYIKSYILSNFDFSSYENLEKEPYKYFRKLPKCVKKNIKNGEITELYKKYALLFGDMIDFLKKYDKEFLNLEEFKNILPLRNSVMHHVPLLFDINSDCCKSNLITEIYALINLLPVRYHDSIKKKIGNITKSAKENLNEIYHEYLLEV